ncbi:MAG: hypothetical protein F6K41_13695 [Symploca sp. SIO3E6]|nr:hypothetical protein [Caldora sp. SIO3E6]
MWVVHPRREANCRALKDKTVRLWPVESLDDLLVRGCNWLEDYLRTNPDDSDIDEFCAGIRTEGSPDEKNFSPSDAESDR